MKKIDIYNHVLPPYFELVKTHSRDTGFVKRVTGIRMLGALVKSDLARWRKVIKDAGITAE